MDNLMLWTVTESEITESEKDELKQHEAVIERGLKTFVDVGNALLAIRDGRLYRGEYDTFEDYCRDRWGWGRNYSNKLIASAEVINNLGTIVPILPETETQARPLTSLEPEQQREAWTRAIETAPETGITAAHVQRVVDEIKRPVSYYHVSDDSYEWYTPEEYIEAARGVMGSIDTDPATSEQAQQLINAGSYYTKETNGLLQTWSGNVWLNPPYNMPLIEQFVDKTISEYKIGNISAAIVLTNNSTDTGWFHKLAVYPFCLTKGRIQFINGDERLATRQGQAIFYLGNDPDLFAMVFGVFGVVVKTYDDK